MFSENITNQTHTLIKALKERHMKLSAAESCTGGLLCAAITEIPGSSNVFDRGYVTYSNDAKIELLTVPTFYITDFGAVSYQTAIAMAEGALLMSKANISISITGVAGPEGGTEDKPVGTVFLACALDGKETKFEQHMFSGSRRSVRLKTVEAAMNMLLRRLET